MDEHHALEQLLLDHEGERLCPYRDSQHHLSIGIGHNLDADPRLKRHLHGHCITHAEALGLMYDDIDRAQRLLDRCLPFWRSLSENRRLALQDLAFNLNEKLCRFPKMLHALGRGEYKEAAKALLHSRYRRHVGERAVDNADLLEDG